MTAAEGGRAPSGHLAELCGLRWSDIDLDHGALTIERNRTTVGYQVVEGDPKTPAGRRAVARDKRSVQILRVHRRYEQDRKAEAAESGKRTADRKQRLPPRRNRNRCFGLGEAEAGAKPQVTTRSARENTVSAVAPTSHPPSEHDGMQERPEPRFRSPDP